MKSKPKEYFNPKTGKIKKPSKAKSKFLTAVENLEKAKTKNISINCDLMSVTTEHFTLQAEFDFGGLECTVGTKDLLEVAKLIKDAKFSVCPHYEARRLGFVWEGNETVIAMEPPTNEEHATGAPEPNQSLKSGVHTFFETLFTAGGGVSKDNFDLKLRLNNGLDRVVFDGEHVFSTDGYLFCRSIFHHSFGKTLTIHGSAYRMFRNLDLPSRHYESAEDFQEDWEVTELGLTIKFAGSFELFCVEPRKVNFPDISRYSEGAPKGEKIPLEFWKTLKTCLKADWIEIQDGTMTTSDKKSFALPEGFLEHKNTPWRCDPQNLIRLAELTSAGTRFEFINYKNETGVESWLAAEDPCGDVFYLAGLFRKNEA